jgi:hypothetical protein
VSRLIRKGQDWDKETFMMLTKKNKKRNSFFNAKFLNGKIGGNDE